MLRDVSRTSDGWPMYLSIMRNPMRFPSRAPYTPSARHVMPHTSAVPRVLSASKPLMPCPTARMPSCSRLMALAVSASTRAIICRRITSSLARFSAMRPSASAMDLDRTSSLSFSAFCRSVFRLDAWICSSVERLRLSWRCDASSCILTISALRWRVDSCSAWYRLRASWSSYSLIWLCCAARCWSVVRCSSCRTRSVCVMCCAASACISAVFAAASCCFVCSCDRDSSITFFANGDALISRSALAPRSSASGSNEGTTILAFAASLSLSLEAQ
mmetsp:Transcript_35967/g.88606  ORF Transcript_35967/g.88606 Transcript_35967/m.88606 type:complete len:274 (+) Transcript_35967:1385-2206(+)